jgi:outer membrane translocation and assembly module TamA
MQAEWRQQVYRRWGFTVFAGVGDVWRAWDEIRFKPIKWSAGGGIRFNFNPDDPSNIRLDVGAGPDTFGLYLQFGEAF